MDRRRAGHPGDFAGDSQLHVNCADTNHVDIDRLHLALTRAFVGRQNLVAQVCKKQRYRLPVDDDRVMTYDPNRPGWPGEKPLSPVMDALLWGLAIAIVGSGIALLLWFLRAF